MEEARGEIKEIREEQTLFVGMLQTGTTKTISFHTEMFIC
jgi:hypothetical protein